MKNESHTSLSSAFDDGVDSSDSLRLAGVDTMHFVFDDMRGGEAKLVWWPSIT